MNDAKNIKRLADNYRASDAPSVSHRHRVELHTAIDALARDAERYRWLREQHWQDNEIAVVLRPKDNVALGAMLPFDGLLDNTIDLAIKEEKWKEKYETP